MTLYRKYLVATISALLYGAYVPNTHAQSKSEDPAATTTLETVNVKATGTHIKGITLSGVGPVTVIDAEAIERSGASSIDVLLQRMPSSAGTAGNQSNAYWTGDGWGTSQVSLRGLGPGRTLVLLNGRRIVNGGSGANSSVDLNTIPVSMIERIEVLKDGASAIYGADAVAGVVNIITKRGFKGVSLSAKYGQTFKNDGADVATDLTWGSTSERGSMMAGLSYSEGKKVSMDSRAPCALGEVSGSLQCVGSSSTIGGRARLADGRIVNFNQDPNGDPNSYHTYSSKDNYNSNPYLNLVNPIKRLSVAAFGDYAITENIKMFSELLYSNRRSNQLATPGTLGVFRTINIAANHPTNPTGQDLVLQRRRLQEGGPRIAFQDVDTFRAVLGLEGKLGAGWEWGVSANYGRNTAVDGFTNVANLDRVDNTLNRAICGTTPGAPIPCANYLGYGNVTQEALNYIMFTSRDLGGNQMLDFSANVSGPLFDMPAGSVGFASGVNTREERGWRHPNEMTRLGLANTNRADNVDGKYKTKEAFVEVSVPLLADIPFANALTLNAAARYSDYDLFGTDTNYKIGIDWQVVPSFKLRATRSTAFRIPSIPQLFGGLSTASLNVSDPCSNWSTMSPSSTIYQNCQAHGVPAGYTQFGNIILTTGGGNIALNPEGAKTTTVGLAWTPEFTSDLTLTLDYYKIKIDNAVSIVAGSTKLALCYNTPGLSHPFCNSNQFTRNSTTGEINMLSNQPVNAASETASGIDFGLLHTFQFAGMNAILDLDITYLKKYGVRPYLGAEEIDYTGKLTGGNGSYAKWRSFGSLTLNQGPWSGSYSIQYIGKADDINAARGDIGDRAPGIFYHNVQAKYAFNDSFDIAFGVDNLLDKSAPFVKSYTDGNTDTMTYDLLGRRWNMRVNYRW